MGQTRVDLQHLLEDLRDAYTGSLEETILTEVVANALDSGASRVQLSTNPAEATLTIVDDGRGMQRRELARYHDVATSSKSRGEGIGFAGVGIKLGLLVSREVVTETRRGSTHVASSWHLASRYRAPWKWIAPPGLTASRGTAVRLVLTNQLSPLLDAGYLDAIVRKHFEPLLEPEFDEILRRHYRAGVAFVIDGRAVTGTGRRAGERVTLAIRLGRRRTPSALGYLERDPQLPADRAGIAISTFGKVIKRGWDWLGIAAPPRARVGGLLEASDLAACLTLSKNDFIRSGARGATYLAYRKAIQEVVSRQLAIWGDAREGEARPHVVKLERDLERVLEDLADDFPLLRSLVDRRAGGQKRLPLPGRGEDRVPAPLFANLPPGADGEGDEHAAAQPEQPAGGPAEPPGKPEPPVPAAETEPPREAGEADPVSRDDGGNGQGRVAAGTLDTVAGRRRPGRYGMLVQFESRPDDPEPGRLVDSTIFINDAHPAFSRAMASRSLGYHTALSVALSLAPLAGEQHDEHTFITQFLVFWGNAQESPGRPSRRRRTRKS